MNFMNKESTAVMLLSYYTNSSQPNQAIQPFPLPGLSKLIGIHVPIYDLKQYLQATPQNFIDKLDYISVNADEVRTVTIWMIVLCAIFFLAGIIAYCVTRNSSADIKDSETKRSERDSNDPLIS